jgi:hypothetical protein
MNILDHISESLETIFGVIFFDADPDLRSRIFLPWIRNGKKIGSGIRNGKKIGSGIRNGKLDTGGGGINILDPQHRLRMIGSGF